MKLNDVHRKSREVGGKCRSLASDTSHKGKKGFVYFITSDKVIQAVMTASAFAVVASAIENFALLTNAFIGLPKPTIVLVSMIVVFYTAMWADNNTEEWREIVERTTGEEVADDEVEE